MARKVSIGGMTATVLKEDDGDDDETINSVRNVVDRIQPEYAGKYITSDLKEAIQLQEKGFNLIAVLSSRGIKPKRYVFEETEQQIKD